MAVTKKVDYNYEEEEKAFIKELQGGDFDIDTMPNEGDDFFEYAESDFNAFKEHLQSDENKQLHAGVLKPRVEALQK